MLLNDDLNSVQHGGEMKKTADIKEHIIAVTTELINQSNGNIAEITTRLIADQAGIGIGLINYHFQSKENLIEICVERIINKVILAFAPPTQEQSLVLRLKHSAKLVFEFFVENPAVTRISILSDYKNPKQDDNTRRTITGICKGLGDDFDIPESKRHILAFTLVSVMQAMFLRKDQTEDFGGYDFTIKEQRDEVLDLLIDRIFAGFEDEK